MGIRAAASLLRGWLIRWFFLKGVTHPLPLRLAGLKALLLLCGLILAPAPDQRNDPDSPYVLTLRDRQEA
jgi:hypothetical protein